MALGEKVLGLGINYAANRLLGTGKKNVAGIDKFISGGGITGVGTGTKGKGKSTFTSIAKQGIMGLIARSILGPIFGPIALTLGQNIFNKNKGLGLGFFGNKGDGITKGPPGIPKGPVTSPDTPSNDGFQVTGNYAGNDFYSAEGTTVDSVTGDLTDASGNYAGNIVDEFVQPSPSPPSNNDSNGDSGGGGGQSDSQAGADASQSASDEDAGAGGYAYGGRASYSGGGLASLL